MSDRNYKRTKRETGARYFLPIDKGGIAVQADRTLYAIEGTGWRRLKRVGERIATNRRNSPCPCGSGKRFKRCCLDSVMKEMAS